MYKNVHVNFFVLFFIMMIRIQRPVQLKVSGQLRWRSRCPGPRKFPWSYRHYSMDQLLLHRFHDVGPFFNLPFSNFTLLGFFCLLLSNRAKNCFICFCRHNILKLYPIGYIILVAPDYKSSRIFIKKNRFVRKKLSSDKAFDLYVFILALVVNNLQTWSIDW